MTLKNPISMIKIKPKLKSEVSIDLKKYKKKQY